MSEVKKLKQQLDAVVMKSNTSNPGSKEALALGCACSVLDNCRGRGIFGEGEKFGWIMNGNCPLHGDDEKYVAKTNLKNIGT